MIDEIKAIIEAHTFAPYLGTHTYDNDMIPHLVEYFQGKIDEQERKAWDAARKQDHEVGCYKWFYFTQWKKERGGE